MIRSLITQINKDERVRVRKNKCALCGKQAVEEMRYDNGGEEFQCLYLCKADANQWRNSVKEYKAACLDLYQALLAKFNLVLLSRPGRRIESRTGSQPIRG